MKKNLFWLSTLKICQLKKSAKLGSKKGGGNVISIMQLVR